VRGFMDLVFVQEGRYYLVDWKSNHLGWQVEAYGQAALAREMERHVYHLQYLLYTVALDRFLAARLPDYDYDRHFGGVFYLFLRGIDAGRGPAFGVYADRPAQRLIADLRQTLLATEGEAS
jgi:exodeoxyribonuclease V beta subunit